MDSVYLGEFVDRTNFDPKDYLYRAHNDTFKSTLGYIDSMLGQCSWDG